MLFSSETLVYQYATKKRHHFFLASDLHIFGVDHDSRLLGRQFTAAADADARIIIGGDIGESINEGDPRHVASMTQVAADLKKKTKGQTLSGGAIARMVWDRLSSLQTEEIVKTLSPYVDYIDAIGPGNHETAALKYGHTDVVYDVLKELNRLRSKTLIPILQIGYQGLLGLKFANKDGGSVRRILVHHDHGKGGAAPVTKGMINFNRKKVHFPADVIWMGHKHNKTGDFGGWVVDQDVKGKIRLRPQYAVETGCYKKVIEANDFNITGTLNDFGSERMLSLQATGGIMMICEVDSNLSHPRIDFLIPGV